MTASLLTDAPGRCMKCGFCMSNCPVYGIDPIESHVARGRNMLILQKQAGTLPPGKAYVQSLSHCLLCGRCRAVCPAKVSSPEITVAARAAVVRQQGVSWSQALVFRGILKHRHLMAHLAGIAARLPGLGSKQGTPLRHMADMTAVVSAGIAIPRLSRPFLADRLKSIRKPPDPSATRGRVVFFAGCGFEFFFSGMGQAMVEILTRSGFEVVYPQSQGCCGIAAYNAGDVKTARKMASANLSAFTDCDAIVTGCATCGTALKHYGHWLPQGNGLRAAAESLAGKVWDFSHFVHHHGFPGQPRRKRPLKVTYHDPCHLRWHQGIIEPPRRLLAGLQDIDYVEMDGADACCGLAGSFAITHQETSRAIQAKKMAAIARTKADVVVTSCPGCIVQLMDGAQRHHVPVKVMHIGQMLNKFEAGANHGE
ncbi:MAG: (Fe-S)-binding protein [Desulfatitalea sp.]|nr:(Fe-S)-binding protein [Desulfatitalea sp.]NNK02007.1 (Fe-S)-binding protein [Desulfatitalea sp.]